MTKHVMKNPNHLVFKDDFSRFYEVFYVIFADISADKKRKTGYWLRYTLLNPGDPHPGCGSALWAGISGNGIELAISQDFQEQEIEAATGGLGRGLGLKIGDQGSIRPGAANGKVESGGHVIEWDLEWTGAQARDTGMHPLLASLLEPGMGMRIPYPRAEFSGIVTVDGVRHIIDRAVGHQAHHWGKRKVPGWAWGHACMFDEDKKAVLEILHPAMLPGRAITGPLFINLKSAGGEQRFAGFAREGITCSYEPGRWIFGLSTLGRKLKVEFNSNRDDKNNVLEFLYLSPSYKRALCSNAPVARVYLEVWERSYKKLLGWNRVMDMEGWGTAEITRPL
ncbi:MAG: hypothetical protein GXP49_12535 [Deltaproteobacteria bacterium]|nr:hypothetical protein [Deltaproteobacteria bacterium]